MTLALQGAAAEQGGRRVLEPTDARFARGRLTVVLGPNGAGKSTLLKLGCGLLAPAEGRVLIDGEALERLAPIERARRIGYLPQGGELHWNLAVEDLVALGRLPHRGPRGGLTDADRAAVERALDWVDARHLVMRGAATLSGGERARVLLARVLAGEPEWLLADEPFAALDPAHQIDLAARFREAARAGMGVVLVLHDLTLAARIADDALLLAGGRLLASGAADEVLHPELLGRCYGVAVERLMGGGGEVALVATGRIS